MLGMVAVSLQLTSCKGPANPTGNHYTPGRVLWKGILPAESERTRTTGDKVAFRPLGAAKRQKATPSPLH